MGNRGRAVGAGVVLAGALVVAEGIETEAHLQATLAARIPLGQGFYFGHPEPEARAVPRVAREALLDLRRRAMGGDRPEWPGRRAIEQQ